MLTTNNGKRRTTYLQHSSLAWYSVLPFILLIDWVITCHHFITGCQFKVLDFLHLLHEIANYWALFILYSWQYLKLYVNPCLLIHPKNIRMHVFICININAWYFQLVRAESFTICRWSQLDFHCMLLWIYTPPPTINMLQCESTTPNQCKL